MGIGGGRQRDKREGREWEAERGREIREGEGMEGERGREGVRKAEI